MEAGKTNGTEVSGRNAPVAVQLDVPGTLRDHVGRLAGGSGLTTCEYFHNSVAMTVIADIHERELADGDVELAPGAEADRALVEAAVREAVGKLVDLGMLDPVPGEPDTFTAQWGTFEKCRAHENTKHLELEPCRDVVREGRNKTVPVEIRLPGTLLAHVERLAALRGKTREDYILLAVGFAVEVDLPKPAEVRAGVALSDLPRDEADRAARATIEWLVEVGRLDRDVDDPSHVIARW